MLNWKPPGPTSRYPITAAVMRGSAQLRTGYWLLTGPHNQRKWGTGKHPNLTLICPVEVNSRLQTNADNVRCHVTPRGPGIFEINRLSFSKQQI